MSAAWTSPITELSTLGLWKIWTGFGAQSPISLSVRFHAPPERVLHRDTDPLRTRWFPGGTLNYAEQILRFGLNEVPLSDDRPAVLFCAEPGEPHNRQVLSRKELIDRVAQLASALSGLGVRCGDRVAGYLPNRIETLVAFLATASLGAIWSNCPPELSSKGVLERLTQIEPKVLIAVVAYRYGGRQYDRRMALAEIAAGLPTLRQLIVIPQVPDEETLHFGGPLSVSCWSDLFGGCRTFGRTALFPCRAIRASALDSVLFGNDRRAETDHARAWRHSAGTS